MDKDSDLIIRSRASLLLEAPIQRKSEQAAEGGCGVLGFAANVPVAGRHVQAASRQMHNRGNGKGGGIAMVGLDPQQVGVDQETLDSHYLLQVALLDPEARAEIERDFIEPYLQVKQAYELEHIPDYRSICELEVKPPQVWRYFVRVKSDILDNFIDKNQFNQVPLLAVEDEFIYQNSFRLNQNLYTSMGEQRAFVLSHGRNLSVLKIVGYAENVVDYYQLHDQIAHVWIAHQRYPTKGRVWHPGGAHPFIGLNEALVHNGDFANYHATSEYLRQRNITQQFLTDTEVSVQLFDLWDRVYKYPLEITLEAMAPTTEFDFDKLPLDKQQLYRAVQRTHIHGSPDGPWFFIIARSKQDKGSSRYELIGITDTSMLRPQVFTVYDNQALIEGEEGRVQIGLIASERQAINACLRSLASQDDRFQPYADRYWVARGGSYTDGGAFRFSVVKNVDPDPGMGEVITCENKFGQPVQIRSDKKHVKRSQLNPEGSSTAFRNNWQDYAYRAFDNGGASTFWRWLQPQMRSITWDEFSWGLTWLSQFGGLGDGEWHFSHRTLDLLRDRRYDSGIKRRASLLGLLDHAQLNLFDQVSAIDSEENLYPIRTMRSINWRNRVDLCPPDSFQETVLIDVYGFPAEGEQAAAHWMVKAAELGWRKLIVYNWRGGRFAGSGLGRNSNGLRIDLYGDVGDYAASGLDGGEIHIHGDGQDQVGQIFKDGKLVIYGDAGQTLLYGAKGGEIYVLGSVAGRPLINAVGSPRAVINGTCLDYLAESFMAGDPLDGGGFVIINGVEFDENGVLRDLVTPYPGGNLLSLASGGAIYVRDPKNQLSYAQLNGGEIVDLVTEDWELIRPYLAENERLFGVRIHDLLRVDGTIRSPQQVYRKVVVRDSGLLREAAGNPATGIAL